MNRAPETSRGDLDFVLSLAERTLRAPPAGLGGLGLSDIKLAELTLVGADLSQANLEKATLAAANMSCLDLTGARLSKARSRRPTWAVLTLAQTWTESEGGVRVDRPQQSPASW